MKTILITLCLLGTVSQTFASNDQLSTEFFESDTVEYWILESESNQSKLVVVGLKLDELLNDLFLLIGRNELSALLETSK